MAQRSRRNQRRQGQRRKSNKSTAMRSIHRSLAYKPVRSRVSTDPPPIIRTLSGSTILPILIVVGTPDTGCKITAGSVDSYTKLSIPRDPTTGQLSSCSITPGDIRQTLYAWHQWKPEDLVLRTEFAIKKIHLWGTNPIAIVGSVYHNAEIGLSVDMGDISGTCQVNDAGTSTRRPCVGVTVPFNMWISSSDRTIATIYPDVSYGSCPLSDGDVWGRMHITVDWRRSPSSILAAESTAKKRSTTTSTASTLFSSTRS